MLDSGMKAVDIDANTDIDYDPEMEEWDENLENVSGKIKTIQDFHRANYNLSGIKSIQGINQRMNPNRQQSF